MNRIITIVATLGALSTIARGGITLPDVVLYGGVFIDGQQVTAEDDVTVVARVSGVPDPVGAYHMGDRAPVGDSYVLRIRLESLADGSNQSDNAAVVGQTAQMFIRQGAGPEELVEGADFAITDIGVIQQRHLAPDCSSPQPVVDHSAGDGVVTAPCSGYIDPRPEGDVDNTGCPGGAVFGLSSVVMKFNTDVFQSDGSTAVGAGNFTVTETGGGAVPGITAVTAVGGDNSLIQIDLDRAITLAEWTTIIASDVYNDCGVQLDTSGGNQGPGVNEPDRIDLAFYPGDIDQNGSLEPFDLLAFRLFVQNGAFPAAACSNDELLYFDLDHNGMVEPFDLLEFRFLVNSGCTRDWGNEPALTARP